VEDGGIPDRRANIGNWGKGGIEEIYVLMPEFKGSVAGRSGERAERSMQRIRRVGSEGEDSRSRASHRRKKKTEIRSKSERGDGKVQMETRKTTKERGEERYDMSNIIIWMIKRKRDSNGCSRVGVGGTPWKALSKKGKTGKGSAVRPSGWRGLRGEKDHYPR